MMMDEGEGSSIQPITSSSRKKESKRSPPKDLPPIPVELPSSVTESSTTQKIELSESQLFDTLVSSSSLVPTTRVGTNSVIIATAKEVALRTDGSAFSLKSREEEEEKDDNEGESLYDELSSFTGGQKKQQQQPPPPIRRIIRRKKNKRRQSVEEKEEKVEEEEEAENNVLHKISEQHLGSHFTYPSTLYNSDIVYSRPSAGIVHEHPNSATEQQLFWARQCQSQQQQQQQHSMPGRNIAVKALSLPRKAMGSVDPDSESDMCTQAYTFLGEADSLLQSIAERMMSEPAPKSWKAYKDKRHTVCPEATESSASLAVRRAHAISKNLELLDQYLSQAYKTSAEKGGCVIS